MYAFFTHACDSQSVERHFAEAYRAIRDLPPVSREDRCLRSLGMLFADALGRKLRASLQAREGYETHDRALLTEAVRRFGVKALICAEQIPEMRIARETIYEKLPEDVRRASVLLNSFWAPDLALAVYRKSLCVFGIEMHSQVMAVGSGVPAAVFRHSGFGSKSEMWKDIGLGDWLLDIDEPDYARRGLEVVSGILSSYGKALETVRAAVTQIGRAERTAAEAAFFQAEMGQ